MMNFSDYDEDIGNNLFYKQIKEATSAQNFRLTSNSCQLLKNDLSQRKHFTLKIFLFFSELSIFSLNFMTSIRFNAPTFFAFPSVSFSWRSTHVLISNHPLLYFVQTYSVTTMSYLNIPPSRLQHKKNLDVSQLQDRFFPLAWFMPILC